MQKRTNPLALKGDAKLDSGLPRVTEIELDPPAPAPKKVAVRETKPETVTAPALRTDKLSEASAARRPGQFQTAKSVITDNGSTITYARTPGGIVATKVEAVEPEPADDWLDDVVIDEPELIDEEMIEEETVALEEQADDQQGNLTTATEVIEDEQNFPTLQDFELAARFSLRGRNSRKLILGKVSRDVLRLAQLMHPDEKMSTIIENALLTRIFLENPEAFDAMAAVIEENGGRIKC